MVRVAVFLLGAASVVGTGTQPPTTSKKPTTTVSYPPLSCKKCTPELPCYVSEPYFACKNRTQDKCNSKYMLWCEFTPAPTTSSPTSPDPTTTAPTTIKPTTFPTSVLTCTGCSAAHPCYVSEPYWTCMNWTKEQCNPAFAKWCEF
ncbi:hypothetical protein AeMF1_020315 [Aphanomyces euteiches]|nr:hypothetical protein AeMF1_020315 [Aphanomyces euteiches]KAH9195645.1 hypothetical protein AeNC1_002360 [Aphanomyces euteiches]